VAAGQGPQGPRRGRRVRGRHRRTRDALRGEGDRVSALQAPASQAGRRMDQPTDQRDQRLRNLQALVARGIEPYPYSFERTHTSPELRAEHPSLAPGDRVDGDEVTVAGRVMLLRMLGKLTFATLQDQAGRVQVSFEKAKLADYNALKKLDLGDWLEVTGQVYATRTGELTVDARSFRLLEIGRASCRERV